MESVFFVQTKKKEANTPIERNVFINVFSIFGNGRKNK